MKERRLGRGLSGLINRTDRPDGGAKDAKARSGAPTGSSAGAVDARSRVKKVAPPPSSQVPAIPGVAGRHARVDAIRPNPYQPRKAMDDEELADLRRSIAAHGVLQPLLVRAVEDGYELIAGERRLRAASAAGLKEVPVVVKAANEEDMQTLALVENIQRVDLNAIEKALALRSMMSSLGITQGDVAKRVGKARSTIANLLRLLDLPSPVLDMVRTGAVSEGHARALLRIEGAHKRIEAAQRVIREGLSVRALEQWVGSGAGKRGSSSRTARGSSQPETGDVYMDDVGRRLEQALGTSVSVMRKGLGGEIRIPFHDAEELDRLLGLFDA